MDLHEFLSAADSAGHLVTIDREVDSYLEAARLIAAVDGRPILLKHVKGSPFPVIAGVCSDRRYFGMALGVPAEQVMFRLAEALERPTPLPPLPAREGGTALPSPGRGGVGGEVARVRGEVAPCQEVIEPDVNLEALPFLTHYAADAGPYASAAVAFINDPDTGPNASYHRLLRLDRTRVAARLVERRGTETAWRKTPEGLPVAICIGLPPHVLLAASMAPPPGVDEMSIASALAPTPMATCANSIRVPAEAEFVLEGRITHDLVPEGPFVDLTGTYDFTRMQPVIVIERVTHRRDALYQALLPGKLEHRLLMGMPREPTIYAEVNKVACCLNVHVTPGGASWLHAVVQIAKQSPDDGKRAIEAAFRGHGSLKHVWVVDDDVNIFDPHDVEWAVATRFQADRGLVVLTDQPSSSLDPSAHHVPGQKSRTAKMGIDATIYWDTPTGSSEPGSYRRVGGKATDSNG
ncbi:MAG: UbiD family decarboxylase [Chloroflexi bacterium]|nr:UbiD family decarboxylase [Chloroflexota bacterium]